MSEAGSLVHLDPGQSALLSGDYGTGKSTLGKAILLSVGRGVVWAAPAKPGHPPEFSDIATVVHSASEMEQACRSSAFVVWPSPPSSAGQEVVEQAFSDFCRVAMRLNGGVVFFDEIQRVIQTKRLQDAPAAFQDVVELAHKPPEQLRKVYAAHRQAQIPLTLGGGAVRISTRPFPGDERQLRDFYGREGLEQMKSFEVGDFAYWSQDTGALMPCRLDLSTWPIGTDHDDEAGDPVHTPSRHEAREDEE
jgi:hypothetical protein